MEMETNMQERVSQAKRCFSRLGGALVVMAVAILVIQVLLAVVMEVLVQLGVEAVRAPWVSWLMTFLPIYLVGFPLAMAVLKKLPVERGEQTRLKAGKVVILVFMCFFVMYVGNLVGNVVSALFSGGQAENALVGMVSEINIWKALTVAVVAPVLEEYLFRKQLIDRCVQYGEKTAILFSGLTFGLFHMNLFQFFYAFGLGVLFAYVYVRTRSLRYPIVMHMAVNVTGAVLAPLVLAQVDLEALSKFDPQVADEALLAQILPGLALYLVYLLIYMCMVVAGLVLLVVYRKKVRFTPASQELAKGDRLRAAVGNVGVIAFGVLCLVMIVLNLIPMS